MIGLGLGCFAVGPLRGRIGLERVYALSTLWPLLLGAVVLLLDRGHGAAGKREAAGRTRLHP
jgi:hypothetical protein